MPLVRQLLLWISLLTFIVHGLPRPQDEWGEDVQRPFEFLETGSGTSPNINFDSQENREEDREETLLTSTNTDIQSSSMAKAVGPQVYFLSQGRFSNKTKSMSSGYMARMSAEGGAVTTILSDLDHAPDGIAVDKAAGYIYFSNMRPGSIQRCNLDGDNIVTLVKGFRVGKQLQLVIEGSVKKLYWSDREGMKIMRANVDGTNVEILVDTSRDPCEQPECKHAVGIAVDTKNGWVYWSQKSRGGYGSIKRVPVRFKEGESAKTRTDAQTVLKGLPEPIDLSWVEGYGLYWTDRGEGGVEGGNSVNSLKMSPEVMAGAERFDKHRILVNGLKGGIGIAVDGSGSHRMWFTDLGGHVYRSKLDGTEFVTLASGQGLAVGMDYVP
jgi:hypothetical protein